MKKRMSKATGRHRALSKLRLPKNKSARVYRASVFTAYTFGHQGQGVSPKRRKPLRAMAGTRANRVKMGSLEVALSLGENRVQDPGCFGLRARRAQ